MGIVKSILKQTSLPNMIPTQFKEHPIIIAEFTFWSGGGGSSAQCSAHCHAQRPAPRLRMRTGAATIASTLTKFSIIA